MAGPEQGNNTPDSCVSTVSDLKDLIDSALDDTMLSPDEATQIQDSAYNASLDCERNAQNSAMELSNEILTQGVNITAGTDVEFRMVSYFKVDFQNIREKMQSQGMTMPKQYVARKSGDTVYIHETDGTAIAQVDTQTWEVGEISGIDAWQNDDVSDNIDAQMLIDQHENTVTHMELDAIDQVTSTLSKIGEVPVHIMDRDMLNPEILHTLAQALGLDGPAEVRKIYDSIFSLGTNNGILADYTDDVVSVSKNGDQFTIGYNGNIHGENTKEFSRGMVSLTFNQGGNLLRQEVTKYGSN